MAQTRLTDLAKESIFVTLFLRTSEVNKGRDDSQQVHCRSISYQVSMSAYSGFERGGGTSRRSCGSIAEEQSGVPWWWDRASESAGGTEKWSDHQSGSADVWHTATVKKRIQPGPSLVKQWIPRGLLPRSPQSKSSRRFFMTQPLFVLSSITLVPLTKFLICAQPTQKHRMPRDILVSCFHFYFKSWIPLKYEKHSASQLDWEASKNPAEWMARVYHSSHCRPGYTTGLIGNDPDWFWTCSQRVEDFSGMV